MKSPYTVETWYWKAMKWEMTKCYQPITTQRSATSSLCDYVEEKIYQLYTAFLILLQYPDKLHCLLSTLKFWTYQCIRPDSVKQKIQDAVFPILQ